MTDTSNKKEEGLAMSKDSNTEKDCVFLDEAYEHIGGMGRYQVFLCCLIFLMTGWPSTAVTIVYSAIEMDHWCVVDNVTSEETKDLWIPFDNDTQEYDQCNRYAHAYDGKSVNNTLMPCDRWTYDYSKYGPTIVSYYNLVCDRKWVLSFIRTIYLMGGLIGSLFAGFLSDRYGRQRTMLAALATSLPVWMMGIFAPNYMVYAASRFIVGSLRTASYTSGILLCMEYVSPKWRFFMSAMVNVSFAFGYMLMAGFAVAFKDSVKFELCCLCPSIFFLLFFIVLPESPRFLLVSGRKQEALQTLQTFGIRNGQPLPDYITELKLIRTVDTKKGTFLDLLRSKTLRLRYLVTSFTWMTANLLYYMLTLNSQALIPGNYYLNNFLLAFFEVPASIIVISLASWRVTGRRITTFMSCALTGLCGFITVPLIIFGYDTAVLVFALLNKMFVTMCFNVVYIYTGELYPTEVRHVGFSMTSAAGRISSLCAAFVGEQLTSVWSPLPYIVFGILGTCSGFLDLLLPETLNKNLCETVEEEEKSGREKKFRILDADANSDNNNLLSQDAKNVSTSAA